MFTLIRFLEVESKSINLFLYTGRTLMQKLIGCCFIYIWCLTNWSECALRVSVLEVTDGLFMVCHAFTQHQIVFGVCTE